MNEEEVKEELLKKTAAAQQERKNLPKVRLPASSTSKASRMIGTFAQELGKILSNKDEIFYKPELKSAVEIRKFVVEKNPQLIEEYLGFTEITPQRFITLVETYAVLYIPVKVQRKTEDDSLETYWIEVEKNMNASTSGITIVSEQFQTELPVIKRIFTSPIPILYEGKITLPMQGYDSRFKSWLDPQSFTIKELPLGEAKETINYIFREFCFEKDDKGQLTKSGQQSKTHAIAALLTPYLRGLYPKFNCRTPLFFYLGNRPRVGKDYCAAITGLVYEGSSTEEPAISTGERNQAGSEELRKKILSAMLQGRRRLHFSNNKGYINSAMLEGVLTANTFSDRMLGKNEIVTIENEMEFSLSGNLGITYSPDLANRTRFVNLFLDIEDPNKRKFDTPCLHKWILEHRELILSSLYTLVKTWVEAGMTSGKTAYTSFPEWASVCGGIMTYHEFGDPCQPDENQLAGEGDEETSNMKKLFELLYAELGESGFTKRDIFRRMVNGEGDEPGWQEQYSLFKWLDFSKTGDRVKFSAIWRRNIGRIYSGLRLKVVANQGNSKADTYMLQSIVPKEDIEKPVPEESDEPKIEEQEVDEN